MENCPLKMNSILPNYDTCLKNEGGYCISACSEEKTLSVSKNSSSFGGNSLLNLTTKTIIFTKLCLVALQQIPIDVLHDKYAIFQLIPKCPKFVYKPSQFIIILIMHICLSCSQL